jgi:hypothetical protein
MYRDVSIATAPYCDDATLRLVDFDLYLNPCVSTFGKGSVMAQGREIRCW